MTNRKDKHRGNSNAKNAPYCMVGAGRLTSVIWKPGDEHEGFRYRFNIFRTTVAQGRVSQLFEPEDVLALARLAYVLALMMLDDGCLNADLRQRLKQLVYRLEMCAITEAHPEHNIDLVPISAETLSAIQSVAEFYRRTEEDGYEGDLEATHLLSNLSKVDAWLEGLGIKAEVEPIPDSHSSH